MIVPINHLRNGGSSCNRPRAAGVIVFALAIASSAVAQTPQASTEAPVIQTPEAGQWAPVPDIFSQGRRDDGVARRPREGCG
jgi:hypothetical protein